jgi:hypothetical protein
MTAQLSLDLNKQASRAPKVTRQNVDWFIDQLRGKGWVRSVALGATTEAQKRRLRAIAELADGAIVSYPGSPGYKLLDSCTLEELRRGDSAMRSQLRVMARKWKPIWRKMHRLELVENHGR